MSSGDKRSRKLFRFFKEFDCGESLPPNLVSVGQGTLNLMNRERGHFRRHDWSILTDAGYVDSLRKFHRAVPEPIASKVHDILDAAPW